MLNTLNAALLALVASFLIGLVILPSKAPTTVVQLPDLPPGMSYTRPPWTWQMPMPEPDPTLARTLKLEI